MKKKLVVMSCVSLLILIQPQVRLAQGNVAQDKPVLTESNAANQDAMARETSPVSESEGASNKNLPPQEVALARDNWEALKSIPVGDEITVETRDGKRTNGRMSSITATTLTISRKNQALNFDQPEIKKIFRQVSGGSRGKNSLLGTAIGAAIGAGIAGFFMAALGDADVRFLAFTMGFGASIGAGVGALFKGSKKILIYEVK
jgi:hypothetical protein